MKRILAGPHAVAEALKAAPGAVEVVLIADSPRSMSLRRIEEAARRAKVEVEETSRELLDRLTPDIPHQGAVAVTGGYPYTDIDTLLCLAKKQPHPLIVVLDQVQDPRNLGAVMRSAFAFGACGIVMPKDRSAPVTSAAVRASAGASELIRAARVTNLARALDQLRDSGYQVFGAALTGDAILQDLSFEGKTALVLGSEGKGIRRLTAEHCDRLFRIPLLNDFGSLNVSAAAAVVLYEASKCRLTSHAPTVR
jgi:23S rRNA (guanosine2251-2'-O)-methyltransferase